MDLSKNIKKLRLNADLTQAQLAEKIGVTRATVTQWETGWSKPRMGALEKLSNVFGVSVAALLSDAPKPAPAQGMEMGYVPLVGTVHAGKPESPEELQTTDLIKVPQFLLDADPECYACIAEGDCMDKVYPEGCTIVISPNKEPRNGSIAVVLIDGYETVMRRMFRTPDTLVLSPDSFNPIHKDLVFTGDDRTVEFQGRVVWFQSSNEME